MNKITRSAGNLQYAHNGFVSRGATVDTRLEIFAPLDPAKEYGKVMQGSVISLNAEGKFEPGVGAGNPTEYTWAIPCLCIKNVFDKDVTTGRAAPAGFPAHAVFSPVGGQVTGVPLTAGYEFETSEYVGTAEQYKPGKALVAATGEDLGKFKPAEAAPGGSVAYLGYVSSVPAVRDRKANPQRPSTLRFLSHYIPNTTA